jgi:tRNA (uracil-5-)-methyltransferase TRM9
MAMKPETAQRLIDLNRTFYAQFAEQFSLTRRRLQPGVLRLLPQITAEPHLLDLGCGNGELLRELARRRFRGSYTGLDFSADLLADAQRVAPPGLQASYDQADLSQPGWGSPYQRTPFTAALAFAVLHHIPGKAQRLALLREINSLLAEGGHLLLSNWQFLNSPRLRARVQPWERAGLSAADVEAGDYLLDWRRGGTALRYVHHFDLPELEELAHASGFMMLSTFASDGENAQLGLYQVWQTSSQM